MFKQKNRLKKKLEVQGTVKKGKSVFDPVCGIKFLKNDLDESRFAVVVGLKVHKSAVKRNRVKRQYREVVRLHLDSIKPGFDVVLLTSAKALELTYVQKEERLLAVLRKAGLWKD
jgi:ribonuclease P protein component